jgi:hypothetical protein
VPADVTSAAVNVIKQDVVLEHAVVREEPLTENVVPGPGLVGTKLYPVIRIGKPDAAPAVALAGERDVMATADVSATVAEAVCVASSTLVALMVMLLGLGAAAGAVYTPLLLIVPHTPLVAQETCQVTAVFGVPVTVAANSTVPEGATTAFAGAIARST